MLHTAIYIQVISFMHDPQGSSLLVLVLLNCSWYIMTGSRFWIGVATWMSNYRLIKGFRSRLP